MLNQHPLVCRFGAFGDMVLLTPLLRRLYHRCGKPVDVVAIGNWPAILFQHMPYVRYVHTLDSRKTPYLLSPGKRQLAKKLRDNPYQFVWICETQSVSYRIMKKAGIKQQKTINAIDSPAHTNEHYVKHWLRLANQSPTGFDFPVIEDDDSSLNTELFVDDDEISECNKWLKSRGIEPSKPLICIQAGNKRTMRAGKVDRLSNTKYWHKNNWSKLIDEIILHLPGAQILFCGIPAEHGLALNIKELCVDQKQIHSLADDLPMRRLLALLSISHSCISVDTGPAHAAAALNCPLTVLFGKADHRIFRPISSESKVMILAGRKPEIELLDGKDSWADTHDINLIKTDDVFNAWLDSTSV
jgi:ADP-heptose:LPS heptosyltransferase